LRPNDGAQLELWAKKGKIQFSLISLLVWSQDGGVGRLANDQRGTEFEQFGDGLETAIVLSVVGEGMPLIYNGQEAGNPKRLQFFERDPIEWKTHPNGEIYKGANRLF
jgi:hypothetical protein